MLNMLMKYKITMSLCKIGDWWKQSIEFENWYFIGQSGKSGILLFKITFYLFWSQEYVFILFSCYKQYAYSSNYY